MQFVEPGASDQDVPAVASEDAVVARPAVQPILPVPADDEIVASDVVAKQVAPVPAVEDVLAFVWLDGVVRGVPALGALVLHHEIPSAIV